MTSLWVYVVHTWWILSAILWDVWFIVVNVELYAHALASRLSPVKARKSILAQVCMILHIHQIQLCTYSCVSAWYLKSLEKNWLSKFGMIDSATSLPYANFSGCSKRGMLWGYGWSCYHLECFLGCSNDPRAYCVSRGTPRARVPSWNLILRKLEIKLTTQLQIETDNCITLSAQNRTSQYWHTSYKL